MQLSNELPSTWAPTTIGEICTALQYGYTASASEEKCGPRFLRITDIQNGRVQWPSVPYCEIDDATVTHYELQPGDIVFARTGGTVGKSFIISSVPERAVFASYLIRLSAHRQIDPAFLYYFFQSASYWEQIGLKKGGLQGNVNATTLSSLQLSICPLNEQRRIVAKIEELFSELDKGIECLKTAREQLKVYRHALLKHAFEGKLTAQWRADNSDKLESADQLLAAIQSERESHATRQRKRRSPKEFSDFSSDEQEGLPPLPLGWLWAKLGYLFQVVSGATPKGIEQVRGSDIPYYKISDMNTPGNETKMNVAALNLSEQERAKLGLTSYPSGTVTFPKRGGAILTNKKRMLSRPSCFDLNTMGVVNILRSISTDYLWYWFQKLDLSRIYDGSNVPQINNKNVDPLPFPVCSLAEQREIVRLLEEKISVVDQMDSSFDIELKKAEALRQSILKKAFSGQLVEQDPNDVPASALLERIKVEQASLTNGNKKKRKGKEAA